MTPESTKRRVARLAAYERRAFAGNLLLALPATTCLAVVLIIGEPGAAALWVMLASGAVATLALARWQYRRLTYPIHTLVSLLEALREGDYTLRGSHSSVLGDVVYDINALANRLQQERLQFEESTFLLSKTLAALDSAVMVFDEAMRLRLLNPAGRRLLGMSRHEAFGRTAMELGLHDVLAVPSGDIAAHRFTGGDGRFEVRHASLRTDGRSGRLLVLNDVGRLLREEERLAWQRLLRVLGHEVNNSLAPIHSMAGTLASLTRRDHLPDDWRDDFSRGLDLIEHRAGALTRFLSSYGRLTRLPAPRTQPVDIGVLVGKVASFGSDVPVLVEAGSSVRVQADPDQLEQALINLLRNAGEASPSSTTGIRIGWRVYDRRVAIEIRDEGLGPPTSDNLFVPFFTTKPGGSGIGLALSRQIAEGHGGGVTLAARTDGPGTIAVLWLPLGA